MIFKSAARTWACTVCAFFASLLIISCGSSSVGSNSPPPAPGPLSVIPGTATVFSGVPTTFVVSGGSGIYNLVSSNQLVIPNATGLSGGSFVVVANAVGSDTPVTLTVRDAVADSQVELALNVKPRTVESAITITPTSSQSATCGTAICSGGDAEVVATLSQGGAPLAGRQVRFEAVSGDFRFITSPIGTPETLATSITSQTDTTGTARVRIRVLNDATDQTAIIQITDVVSGAFQRTSFGIAVAATAVLNAQPRTIAFRGLLASACADGISADVIVVGGRPPYTISNPGAFRVSPQIVTNSGGRFTVSAIGQCSPGSPIAVVDSVGSAVTVTASNEPGPIQVDAPSLVVGPVAVALGQNCNSIASVLVAGGLPPYLAMSSDQYLTATVAGNIVSIRRTNASTAAPAPTNTLIPIAITDGREVVNVSVTVPPGPCT